MALREGKKVICYYILRLYVINFLFSPGNIELCFEQANVTVTYNFFLLLLSPGASFCLSWTWSLPSNLYSCWWTLSMKAVSWVRGTSGPPPAPPGPSPSSWPVTTSSCLPGCCWSARHADRTKLSQSSSQVNMMFPLMNYAVGQHSVKKGNSQWASVNYALCGTSNVETLAGGRKHLSALLHGLGRDSFCSRYDAFQLKMRRFLHIINEEPDCVGGSILHRLAELRIPPLPFLLNVGASCAPGSPVKPLYNVPAAWATSLSVHAWSNVQGWTSCMFSSDHLSRR